MRTFLPTVLVLLLPCCRLSAAVADDFLDSLREADASELVKATRLETNTSNLGFGATFIATNLHTERLDEGAEVLRCEAVWTNGFCLMTMSYSYAHDPVFRARSPNEYDRQGNRRMSRPSWIGAIFSPQRNESRQELIGYVITPDGDVTAYTNSSTAVEKYKIGDRNSIYFFDRFRNVTGRGFAQYLKRIASRAERLPSGNTWSVEAVGNYSTWLDGRWAFKYEEGSGYLVREASFTPKGREKALLVVANSATVECPGLKIAASGAETYGDTHRTEIQVLSLTNFTSSDVIKSKCAPMLELMDAPVPPGKVDILDRRGPVTKRIRQ